MIVASCWITLETLQPFAAKDAIHEGTDELLDLRRGQIRGTQLLELIGRHHIAAFDQPIG